MLPADLQAVLAVTQHPVLVAMPRGTAPLWAPACRPTEFVLAVEGRVWHVPPTEAPFLANVWSRIAVIGFPDSAVLQYFDHHAAVRPLAFIDFAALSEMTAHLVTQQGHAIEAPSSILLEHLSPFQTLFDEVYTAAAGVVMGAVALYKDTVLKPFNLYANDWLAARQLLDLMAVRGYWLPDTLAEFRGPDGLLHPRWTVPVVPGRITTAQPPLHALKHAVRDTLVARPGSRWVLVQWPEVVSVLASLTTYGVPGTPVPGSDFALGRHDVPAHDTPPDLSVLQHDWMATQRSYPLPTPALLTAEYTPGRRCLEAVSAFTVAQLAALYQSWRRDEPVLLGLSDVTPYLGTLAFQIDDRVPLPLLQEYFTHLHAFHVPPVVTVGQTRGAMYPIADALTPVALDLDKPSVWPVDCPVCGGRADNERDLLQHYKEDHPGVSP